MPDESAVPPAAAKAAPLAGSAYHACLSNLVIYTEDPEDGPYLAGVLAEYVVKHPCRVILIMAQPRQPKAQLEAALVSHTYVGAGGRSVTCDQITLQASGSSVKEVSGAVQPLLVADLPVNLWWRGVFLHQRPLVEQMLAFADRFIYDGAQWTNLHYTVLQVADCIDAHDEKVGFTNFNWSRLRPWRESVADFFDAGMFEKEVWEINRVRVEYMALPGNEEGQHFRALLFVSWLAVQLGWQPGSGMPGAELSRLQLSDRKGGPVEAELAFLPQSGPRSQSIQKVVLGIRKGSKEQDFIVERDHREHLVVLSCRSQGATTVIRKTPHADSSVADLLHRELGRRVRNRVFEDSFKMAAKLLQMI